MSYSSWKISMWVASLAVAAGLGLVIFEPDKGLNAAYMTFLLIPAFVALLSLSLFRPKVMWAVVTLGKARGSGEQIKENYGPFNSGRAARKFASGWNMQYQGFAVIEYREVPKTTVDNS